MSFEIVAVLAILLVSLVLFVTEWLRMDVVALLVFGTLAVTGLVSPDEALAGFSNPAVVTVWAMFILSAGLSATGVADVIGRHVLRLAGTGEARMIFVIMITAGVLSAFMNNIGVAALMLPVVMDIAHRTGTAPSRLLMPMAYGSLLGGLTTLVGTPPNLVASTVLEQRGHDGFELFEFSPIGAPALVLGALFVAFIGRHLLPDRIPEGMKSGRHGTKLQFSYALGDRRFRLRVSEGSPLHGRPLRDSGLAGTLGLHVLSIERGGRSEEDVGGDTRLEAGDVLHVQGRVEDFHEFQNWRAFEMAGGREIPEVVSLERIAILKAEVGPDSQLEDLTVEETDFHRRFAAHILAIHRGERHIREDLRKVRLKAGDVLTLETRREAVGALRSRPEFSAVNVIPREGLAEAYPAEDALVELMIPHDSHLAGVPVSESGLGDQLHLRVIGMARKGGTIYLPGPDEKFQHGDQLLAVGRPERLEFMRAIQSLELLETPDHEHPPELDTHGLAEVTLSPRSHLPGRTLRELNFRQRYGLAVLAIWRQGRAIRSYLHKVRLEFGDALLLFGSREKVEALAEDPDFIILTRSAYKETARQKPARALIAAGLMLAVVLSVLLGWLPIAVAAVSAAGLMVALRCLSMDDAYRAIEWKSVFLIAAMMPLGTAMQTSGAARLMAEGVSSAAAPFGDWGLLLGVYLLTALATTIVPTTALVLIMAPIAIETSAGMGIDPRLLIMGVAMAASASFTSPISHPANVLVMGPGGYRFMDYVRMGVVLALVVMITVIPLIMLRYG